MRFAREVLGVIVSRVPEDTGARKIEVRMGCPFCKGYIPTVWQGRIIGVKTVYPEFPESCTCVNCRSTVKVVIPGDCITGKPRSALRWLYLYQLDITEAWEEQERTYYLPGTGSSNRGGRRKSRRLNQRDTEAIRNQKYTYYLQSDTGNGNGFDLHRKKKQRKTA